MKENYYENEEFINLIFADETFEKYRFIDCKFFNCTIECCKLVKSVFSGCEFQQCRILNLKAESNSQLQRAKFSECQLIGVNWNELSSVSKLGNSIKSLHNCRLKYNTFTAMNFKKFDFSMNEITDSMFAECVLTESKFKRCSLERTEFFKSDLREADFREASGYQIDIMSCKMDNSKFSFPEAIILLNSLRVKIE